MTDIIPFKKPVEPTDTADEELVWVCGHCGSRHFELYSTGATECALCGFRDESQHGNWHELVQPDPAAERPDYTRTVKNLGSIDLAKASVLKSADEDTCAIVLVWPNGKIRAWSTTDRTSTDDEKQGMRKLMANAASLITGDPEL